MKNIIILLIILGLVVSCNGSKEPEAQGLKLSVWVERLDDSDPAVRLDALTVIKEIGKPAGSAEDKIRTLARQEQYPDVKMKAVEALQAMGKSVEEFRAFIAYYTAPFDDTPTEDGGMSTKTYDEDGGGTYNDGQGSRTPGGSSDDLDMLKELMEDSAKFLIPDSLGNASRQQADEKQLVQLGQKRRTESMQNLMDQIQNPGTLVSMLEMGDLQEKIYALSKLASQSGENSQVVSALDIAQLDSDSTIRRLAKQASKNWTLP